MDFKNFMYAGIAGITSRTATAPLERIKVLYQNKKNINIPYYSYFPNLIKKEGIKSLFNGNGINCLRVFPESAIRFSVFDYSKRYFDEKGLNKNINYFFSGSIGGIVASCTVYPIETVRTKLTAQSN